MANQRKTFSCLSLCGCIAISLLLGQSYAIADENKSNDIAAAAAPAKSTDTTSGAKNAGSSDASPTAQVATLKQEQIQLRQMAEAIKRVNRAGFDIIGECTQPVEMMGEIDIIGMDVIPIMPATAEGFANQYVPPRSKYIKLHMSQLAGAVPILQDEINNLVIPPAEKDYAAQPLADLKGLMQDTQMHMKKLQDLTKVDDDYNVLEITSEARGIDACCKDMNKARHKLLHEDDKAQRKEEKLEREQEKQDRQKK
jgi:hypothetical protein